MMSMAEYELLVRPMHVYVIEVNSVQEGACWKMIGSRHHPR